MLRSTTDSGSTFQVSPPWICVMLTTTESVGSVRRLAMVCSQAPGGYGYAYLFAQSHENYRLIFTCGAVAMAVAFVTDFAVRQPRAD
ncbi:hypothetical protein [Cupriavidus sp. IDO]|uniref:hypothetical protein n=1 Tax=Cupriavidus sp. IDO TaxID=1539142 RepID=UPI000691C8F7|nr:hypothetical protein RM96_07185 [Cupriavidus sp. IDO]